MLLVVGDAGSGKTRLLQSAGLVQTRSESQSDLLLECTCIDSTAGVLEIWELAGGDWVGGSDHDAAFHAALQTATLSSLLVMMVIDHASPKSAEAQLNYWLGILRTHMEKSVPNDKVASN